MQANYYFRFCLIISLLLTCKYYISSQTFNGTAPLPFPPTGTIGQTSSIATVSGVGILGGCKQIENVTIDLDHTWDGDIALFLICPDGTFLELSSANGGGGDNYKITVFKDNAAINVISGAPPFNGEFMPEGRQNISLFNPYSNANAPGTFTFQNTFDGKNADGDWTLFLNDWVGADLGVLNAWSITFTNGSSFTLDLNAANPTCPGNPVNITATVTPSGSYTYNWANNNSTPFTGQSTSIINSSPTANTTYTVTVTDPSGSCTATDEITISVPSVPNPGDADVTASPTEICFGQFTTLTFTNTVSNAWIYNVQTTSSAGTGNISVNVTGTSGTLVTGPSLTTTYTIISITDQATGCTFVLPNPVSVTVIVNNTLPTFSVLSIPPLCAGTTIDLNDYVVLTNGTTATFHSDSPANAGNEINSLVTPLVNTLYTVRLANGPCFTEINILVTVLSSGNAPSFSDASICTNQTLDLNSLINPATPGQFSGPNVTGSNFSSNASGDFVITFTPTSTCYSPIDATITVIQTNTPILLPGNTCFLPFNPLLLTPLQDPLYTNGTWSGPGVTGNEFDAPSAGTFTLTFTSSEPCILPATTQIIVDPPVEATLIANTYVCQDAPSIDLTGYVTNGIVGTWSGPGVTGDFFDPSNLSGLVTLQFTPSALCNIISTTTIDVIIPQQPNMVGTEVCKTNTAFNLTSLEDPLFAGGIWTGPGVSGNFFNASALSGNVVLVFQSNNLCAIPTDITISILNPTSPILDDFTLCEASGLYDLTNLQDPNYSIGTWTGPGVVGTDFDPINLSGIVNLTFTSSEICVNPANTTAFVNDAYEPLLGSTTLCNNGPIYNLTFLEDPNAINGTWTGQGVTNSNFDPTNLLGSITLTYQALGCAFLATTTINMNAPTTPLLSATTICENGLPLNLATLADPNFTVGIWQGDGVNSGLFDPMGLQGNIPLTFISSSDCTLPAFTSIDVNSIPTVSNVDVNCDASKNFYIVSFEIAGGNALSYIVNGNPSSNLFSSSSIASGDAYSFSISDANNCAPILLQGSKNCACITNAGTMNISAIDNKICKDNIYSATHNGDQVLDNDNFIFVLHDNPGPSLGNILATNATPTFGFPVGGQLNTKYYISAVAGNANGQLIDLNDPCLSVSSGAPVEFYEIKATLAGQSSACLDKDFSFEAILGGIPPFTLYLSYTNAGKTIKDTIITPSNIVNVNINPINLGLKPGSCTIAIDQVKDAACFRNDLTSNVIISINGLRNSSINTSLCKGESIVVNGTKYDENKKTGIETIVSSDLGFCDSTIIINLAFKSPVTKNFNAVVCQGKSILINGTIYDETNPTGIETFKAAASNGCDSIVTIAIDFKDKLTTVIDTAICKGNSLVINGTTYSEAKLTGSTMLLSKDGCDSIVNVNVVVNDLIKKSINPKLCEGESITIGGKIFNASNNNGSVIVGATSANSCDTIISVKISFLSKTGTEISQSICEYENLTINGNVYNKDKTTGIEIIKNGSINGCDSIININLSIIPRVESSFDTTLCNKDSIVIFGKIFDRKNPSGSITLESASFTGCDSIINIKVNFYPLRIDTIRKEILPSDSFKIANTIFDINKPNGLVQLSIQSTTGCDSIAYVILSFINTSFNVVDIQQSNEVCLNANDGSIEIKDIQGCKVFEIKVGGIIYTIDKLPFVISPLKPGSYDIEIKSKEGCYYENKVVIAAAPEPVPFVVSSEFLEVTKGENVALNLNISPKPALIQWTPSTYLSCDNCQDLTFLNPIEYQEYQVLLNDDNGCPQSTIFKLIVKDKKQEIIFPNVININASNNNNVWTVLSNSDYKLANVSIYDRWGSKVFESKSVDGNVAWDGRFNGSELIPGVYVYYAQVQLENGEIKPYVGDITILK